MSKVTEHLGPKEDRAIEEASAWLALLHGPRQAHDIAQGLRRWMDEDPAHKEAFESVTRTWEMAGGLSGRSLPPPRRSQRAGFRMGLRWGLAAAAAAVAVLAGGIYWLRPKTVVATDVGEQRILTLQDDSRVYMNTDTTVRVLFNAGERVVELEKGEALFEVAQDRTRPFIVRTGRQQVRALGTSFVIRRDADSTTVTLIDGRVSVANGMDASEASTPSHESVVLAPGERLTIGTRTRRPSIDHPQIENVTAWRQGRIELRDMPLSDAVSEMNRYSNVKLSIETPEAAHIRVTGAFRAGDSVSFAQSVAANCALNVVRRGDDLRLEGAPADNCK